MNLAFLTTEYPSALVGKSGGIGTSIRNLAQSYIKLGHNVFIFVIFRNFDDFLDGEIKVISIKPDIKLSGAIGVIIKSKSIENKINKYIIANKIKFIEIPDWSGMAAFMNFKCKKVIKFNGSDAYFCKLEGRKQKLKNYFLEYKNILGGDIYIYVSVFTKSVTKSIFRIRNKPTYVIPNAINLDNFCFNNIYTDSKSNCLKILYLGTIIRKKGCLEIPYIFNEVLKHNSNVQLVIVGNDAKDIFTQSESTWELMKPLFSDISKVDYSGSLSYEKVKSILAEVDICIYPSFAEALPMTWIEAMAMQKAIVASDIGWAKEVIEDGVSGFLVNPKKHIEYADRILEMLTNPKLRLQMGVEARKVVEDKFDVMKIAKQHIEIFNNIS